MVTNYENLFTVLDDDPGWKGGMGSGFIETILMTDSGLEVFSGVDRNVTVIEQVGRGGRLAYYMGWRVSTFPERLIIASPFDFIVAAIQRKRESVLGYNC